MSEHTAREFIESLVELVRAEHPSVDVDVWSNVSDGTHTVNFVPQNSDGASVTVSADADGTIVVECGACVLRDADFDNTQTPLDSTAALVLAFADHGYIKVRTAAILGPLSPSLVGPASGFFGLDEYTRSPLSAVVERLEGWAAAPSA